MPILVPDSQSDPPAGGGFNQSIPKNEVRNGDRQKAIAPCLNADPCQDRTRPRLVGIATAACCGLTHAYRLVRDAYGGAAEFYNDERDALRANQAHTEAKAVCLLALLICLY